MNKYQQGATLITVLMVLLLIMVLGTLAIRQSISSLKLVSNNQIQTLLLQNADAALVAFQRSDPKVIAGANGIIGFFQNESNKNAELVFCFSDTDPFVLSKAAYRLNTATFSLNSSDSGACTEDSAKISSGREQVVTQVYVKRASTPTVPFADLSRGTEVQSAKTENNIRLEVYVISVMQGLLSDPKVTLFDADNDNKKGCLAKSFNDAVSCLKNSADKPLYSTQVAEYRFLSDFEPAGS
ncbi:PilX N-terminal domain-containing pilus assembly protein [Acinetobacter vivianii]|uniref:PilX N-terminal domain-containing pilus assembly protein n=1 Tax=Acinetobacter vivianii TaxID=1776742 RepID=UPI004041ABAE